MNHFSMLVKYVYKKSKKKKIDPFPHYVNKSVYLIKHVLCDRVLTINLGILEMKFNPKSLKVHSYASIFT